MKQLSLSLLILIFLIQLSYSAEPVLLDYGQDGNCLSAVYANHYSSINEAINHLPATGGIVYCPAGIYTLEAIIVLPSNVSLIGAGIDKTILRAKDNFNLDMIHNFSYGKSGVDSNIVIRDLTLDGNRYNQGSEQIYNTFGITMVNNCGYCSPESVAVRNIIIRDVKVENIGEQGIAINAENLTMENVQVINCLWDNVQLNGNNLYMSKCYIEKSDTDICCEINTARDVIINQCTFRDGHAHGLLTKDVSNLAITNCIFYGNTDGVQIYVQDSTMSSHNISIDNCVMDSNGTGISVWADERFGAYPESLGGVIISNNEIVSNLLKGLALSHCRDVTVQSNRIYNNGSDSSYFSVPNQHLYSEQAGISLESARNCFLLGNVCYDNRNSKHQQYGILEQNISPYPDSNSMLFNDCRGNKWGDYSIIGSHSIWFGMDSSYSFRTKNSSFVPETGLAFPPSPIRDQLFAKTFCGCLGDSMIISNWGFETGSDYDTNNTPSWIHYAEGIDYVQSSVKYDGSKALLYKHSTTDGIAGQGYVYQMAYTPTHGTYLFSVWFRTLADSVTMDIVEGDRFGYHVDRYYSPPDSADDSWHIHRSIFSTTEDSVAILLGFRFGYNGDSVFFDNVTFCPIGSAVDTIYFYNGSSWINLIK